MTLAMHRSTAYGWSGSGRPAGGWHSPQAASVPPRSSLRRSSCLPDRTECVRCQRRLLPVPRVRTRPVPACKGAGAEGLRAASHAFFVARARAGSKPRDARHAPGSNSGQVLATGLREFSRCSPPRRILPCRPTFQARDARERCRSGAVSAHAPYFPGVQRFSFPKKAPNGRSRPAASQTHLDPISLRPCRDRWRPCAQRRRSR